MTQTTPNPSTPECAVSANAARVIEATRHAWLTTATQPATDIAKPSRKRRVSRRPMMATLASVMNFWSTRPL